MDLNRLCGMFACAILLAPFAAHAQTPHRITHVRPSITPVGSVIGISVGPVQAVKAPPLAALCPPPPKACKGSSSVNCFGGLTTLADEHSSILPPGTINGHSDYLFFVATKTCLNGKDATANGDTSGLVVLSGGAGPDSNGVWTLAFPSDFDAYDESINGQTVKGSGQIFLSPMDRTFCANTAVANQDPTFDLNYADAGSVLVDPTKKGSDKIFMIYEGTNRCIGSSGAQNGSFYSTLGVATSLDYGRIWPVYRTNFQPLPAQSKSQGPGSIYGTSGSGVCEGNNCNASAPGSFGRYAVLSPPVTLKSLISAPQDLGSGMGDSEPSAFVDDANTAAGTYVYTVENFNGGGYSYPGAQDSTITVARARLGGSGPLKFMKWYGAGVTYGDTSSGSFAPTTVTVGAANCGPGSTTSCQIGNAGLGADQGGLASALFPKTNQTTHPESYASCQASTQGQLGGAINYLDGANTYLLTFICDSPTDPANAQNASRGAVLFYSTNSDLSDQSGWSTPKEIPTSWNALADFKGKACIYDGWYSTFMSMGAQPGHLSTTGFVFSMKGCQDSGAARQYSSRAFSVTLRPPRCTNAITCCTANGGTWSGGHCE